MYKYVNAIYETLLKGSPRTPRHRLRKGSAALSRSQTSVCCLAFCPLQRVVDLESLAGALQMNFCINQEEVHNIYALAES